MSAVLIRRPPVQGLAPGVAVALAGAAVALVIHHRVGSVSAHVVAVLIGAALANTIRLERLRPGFKWAGRHLVRAGVVLVGFRLSWEQVQALGLRGLSAVVAIVAVTFTGTQLLGRALGVSPGMRLLVGTGFSICGASAIAAAEPMSDAEEHETAYAIALVTLCGSLAIAVLPFTAHVIGLDAHTFGSWAGASIHDVGQVVAAASLDSPEAVAQAVVVKLTRVAMLAPLLTVVAVRRRRTDMVAAEPGSDVARVPLLPWFVVLFAVAVVVRSADVLSDRTLADLKEVETFVLAAGLLGLGSGVEWSKLRSVGGRPLVLGLASWALIALVSLPLATWWLA